MCFLVYWFFPGPFDLLGEKNVYRVFGSSDGNSFQKLHLLAGSMQCRVLGAPSGGHALGLGRRNWQACSWQPMLGRGEYRWEGKTGPICHFAFSLVLERLGVLRYSDAGKNSTNNVIVTPLLKFRALQMLVKTRTWEQCPHTLAGKGRGKWQIDPILPIYRGKLGGPFWYGHEVFFFWIMHDACQCFSLNERALLRWKPSQRSFEGAFKDVSHTGVPLFASMGGFLKTDTRLSKRAF